MAFQVSPGVNVSEIDLTTGIPAVSVSTGAIAGTFSWGPALKVSSVTSEVDMANQFGNQPDNNTAASFFTATSFLAYSNDLRVARAAGTGTKNACANGAGVVINNEDDYFNNNYGVTVAGNAFAARYPGAFGNSLQVLVWANATIWSANSSNVADPLYAFAGQFDFAPGTTPFVKSVSNNAIQGDEIHILVVDKNGLFTGVANTVLEKYQGLSKIKDAQGPDGATNYYKEVLWKKSRYVYNLGIPSSNISGWGNTVASGPTFTAEANTPNNSILTGGADGIITAANTITALGLFTNSEQIDISLVMTADASNVVTNYAISSIGEARKDCVIFASPPLANVQDVSGQATSIVNYAANYTRSSYAVIDSGYKYMYDKYNDIYRWIPLNGDIAGLCAKTDNLRDPWWSPAGLQRGVVKNVVKLAFNPNKVDRDTLYKAGINSVVAFPAEGTILFGDKTFLNYTSAFDRINVRRLFIVLEKSISRAARASLFEFNDTFTRSQFVSLVEPFLRTIKGRRGITDYKVVCDATNNTPNIVDANQFVGDIYIKPARSINFIQLNFVAVRTGVSFSEVVGQF
jgi:hypothetical protein